MSQSVKRPTLDLGSGREIEPHIGPCTQWGVLLRFSLSPPAPTPACVPSLSLPPSLPPSLLPSLLLSLSLTNK